MYGASGKLGRGGGGGGRGGGSAGKRSTHSSFHPPPLHRASSAAPTGRLSLGGTGAGSAPRSRAASVPLGPSTSSSKGTEETFSLVKGNQLDFAMIIRLTPDLVDEIKRVEAEGGSARIKFDAFANNPAGNVINVGGKDFRFTWSREPVDLCDIYEEQKSGEDGNGLLVEAGGAWRKLNVQRVLDISTQDHVKRRSAEAEQMQKARKAIVLDPGNPSVHNNQKKAMAAAETKPWRSFKQRKEPPFKKRKAEPSPGPPKSMNKSGLSTATPSKGMHSTSPLSSPPEQSGPSGSPYGSSNLRKGRPSMENIPSAKSIDKVTSYEKEMPSKVLSSAGRDKRGRKIEVAKPADLRIMLVSLLKENPSGMTLKALEKAIGDAYPNSVKQIEPIIKKIATYQAPGKYILKPGAEMEGFKKPSPDIGSSPLDNRSRSPIQPPALGPSFPVVPDDNNVKEIPIGSNPAEAPINIEKADTELHSPDTFPEEKISDSEGPVGSSSDSDSDSDSDSSDSGSESGSRSRSRSKSRSPVGSGSGSSSDSESDASSNKEASDEDVDIMTSDDDKEQKRELQASELGALKSPFGWKSAEGEPVNIETDEKKDNHALNVEEIENDLLENDHVEQVAGATTSASNKGSHLTEGTEPPLSECNKHQETHGFAGQSFSERGSMAIEDPEQSNNSERVPKIKSKRGFDEKHSEGKPDRSKRFKSVNLNESLVPCARNPLSVNVSHDLFTDRSKIQLANKPVREGTADDMLHNQGTYGKSSSGSQQPNQRSVDPNARSKVLTGVEWPGKPADIVERDVQREKINNKQQNDDGFIKEKKPTRFSREAVVNKEPAHIDFHQRKHDLSENFKETASASNVQMEYSSKDGNLNHLHRSPADSGRGNNLRREPSDLELGELREPLPEDTPGYKKKFERKSSFKKTEKKPSSSEYWNSDFNKGKYAGRVTSESRKTPTPNVNISVSGIMEGPKGRSPNHYANDSTRHHQRLGQPQPEQNNSRVDRVDPGSHCNKLVEVNSNNRESDATAVMGSDNLLQQQDFRRAVVPPFSREDRKKLPKTSVNMHDKRKGASRTESNDGWQRRESSSDENSCSYSKYEKDKPELKEPIKDISQFEDYVQEYNEKYESYLSLNKILESYRNQFSQLGGDIDVARGTDVERYHDLVAQLKESYRQCGEKVKRLKKIFVVLHEELKHLKQMMKDFAASYAKDSKAAEGVGG